MHASAGSAWPPAAHQDVVAAAEGVLVDGAGHQVHLGVVAGGLGAGVGRVAGMSNGPQGDLQRAPKPSPLGPLGGGGGAWPAAGLALAPPPTWPVEEPS